MKNILKYDPKDPDMSDRDRFVLSKGHVGLALYSTMWKAEYISLKELHSYLKPNCHIESMVLK